MSETDPTLGGDAIDPDTLAERLRAGEPTTILDVRNRDEFDAWHVDGPSVEAIQVPHVKFIAAGATGDVRDLVGDLDEPVVVVCGRGEASDDVAAQLREAGVGAVNLAGGMRGWARVYESREIRHPEATVLQYERPASGCLAYLVVAGDEAAVIDPLRTFADRYVADAEARGARLHYAVDTHVHADHVSGVRAVAARSDAEVVLPERAEDRGLAFDARLVDDGEEVPLGDTTLTTRALPGHTTEMTGFSLGDEGEGNLWFTGDTVFASAVARPDLEAGNEAAGDFARDLHETLHERLLVLPSATRLAPGHSQGGVGGEPTVFSVGGLTDRLDVLGLDEDAFVERVVGRMGPQPANYETLVATNLGRRDLADEEAFESELGPNNCAAE
jgi:glyoxylase-like metal-dependent hydrolase (beta-lactamase superfamily II)/rhodanese-related sulfurtransferase